MAQLEVFNEQENGFLGFALDPQFEKNHWIYCFYSPPDYSGQRLSRFRVDDDPLRLDSEKVMLEFEEQRRQCCHHAGFRGICARWLSLDFDWRQHLSRRADRRIGTH